MERNNAAPARAFVTGAGGFAGKHLLAHLIAATDWELYGNVHIRPAPTAADRELEHLRLVWPRVCEQIASHSKALASMFRNPELVRPVSVIDGVCTISFVDRASAQRSAADSFRGMIEQALTHVLGYPCTCVSITFAEEPERQLPGDIAEAAEGRVQWVSCDLTDREQTSLVVEQVRPDYVFHLAAQSNVQEAFKDPEGTLMTNVVGQLHLLDALREHAPDARIMVTCSSEQYGLVQPEHIPIDEETPFRPNNPYAVSKIAQDALALQYYLSYGQEVIRVRPFNHIGPGQTEHFVTSAFARQVALIEAGLQEPIIHVGNLEAERDFTDARDMVRAYLLALTRGQPGEVYNIGSGKGSTIQWVLDTLLSMSTVEVEVRQDPARMRPSDIPSLICDPTRFRQQTGWQPEIPIEQTLRNILDYWREKVRNET
jgi:GDP-4-dehydro-6-deoxy-D-mannose reductase